jgi:hypothetical protein
MRLDQLPVNGNGEEKEFRGLGIAAAVLSFRERNSSSHHTLDRSRGWVKINKNSGQSWKYFPQLSRSD